MKTNLKDKSKSLKRDIGQSISQEPKQKQYQTTGLEDNYLENVVGGFRSRVS